MMMAKACIPGRVKTRLCPPLHPHEAAEVARECLRLTLEAVAACTATRKLLALDGEPGPWIPPGFTVFAQRGDTFADRLANAWADSGGGGLQIGMDTPQLTPSLLNQSLEQIRQEPGCAMLGPASDGGWWAIGTSAPWATNVFADVPMSTAGTGARQVESLRRHGYCVRLLPELRDIDTMADAQAIAAQRPGSRLSQLLRQFDR